MNRTTNPLRTGQLLGRNSSPCSQGDSDGAPCAALTAAPAAGLVMPSVSRRFAVPVFAALSLSIAGLATVGPASGQTTIFPTLPRGTYVASQYTCTRYLEVGLMRLDGQGFSPPKSTCKLVSSDEATGTYRSLCHENDSPSEQERVTLKIKQISKQSVQVNGVVYNYCKGL